MFYTSLNLSNFISCRKYILKGCKGELVEPSQLNNQWLQKIELNPILKRLNFCMCWTAQKRKGGYSHL